MAKDSGTAEAQGLNTNLTHVTGQTPENVFAFICKTLEAVHKTSVSLVVSIAQLMIVRTFNQDDQQRWKMERTRDWLKAQLNERGLKQAMVYRYIATGQQLAQFMVKRYAFGGVMFDVLSADNEQKAFNTIMKCVLSHGYLAAVAKPTLDWKLDADQKPRLSLDVLRVNLGLDKLEPKDVPITNAAPGTVPATPVIPSVPATKAAPASIVSRITADPAAMTGISAGALAVAVEKVIGREVMAERLISLCTLDECLKLQTVLNDRMKTLATEPKPEEKPVEEPATDTPATDQPVEQTETTTAKRSRKRKVA